MNVSAGETPSTYKSEVWHTLACSTAFYD